MKAIRFHAVIGPDQVIQPPQGVTLPPGAAEIIVLQAELPAKEQVPSESGGHLFDRLAQLAQQLGIPPESFPEDLAENHDHYAHGAPKGLDKQ